MRLPSKLFSYSESTIALFPIILIRLKESPFDVLQLYYETQSQFRSLADYMETLIALFALQKIDLDEEGRLYYVN